MKPKFVLSILTALTAIAVVGALAVVRQQRAEALPPGATAYDVRGQVRGVDSTEKTIRIAHEEIPDYMPAMTMPFTVKNASLLGGVAAGDQVRFQLVVTDDDSWISRIEKVASDPAAAVPQTADSSNDREAERIQKNELVPDFELVNQDGQPIKLSDYRGKAVVLTFIYTRCPIPNFCPLMSKNFAALQERLSKEFSGQYQLLSVSIDPEFDRPEILKGYASRYEADERHWTFATGTAEQIQFVAGLMGLFHEPENGLISHDLRTALIGLDGRLLQLWKSNVWTPYEVHRSVAECLNKSKDYAAR